MAWWRARRACRRKTASGDVYDDPAVASALAADDRLRCGLPIHPYRCQVCGRWHNGNRAKRWEWEERLRRKE